MSCLMDNVEQNVEQSQIKKIINKLFTNMLTIFLVRLTGLEPARCEALDPKSNVSTNSTTGAGICGKRMQR